MNEISVTMNEAAQRFETPVGDELAYLDYRWYKKNIAFMHTFVPETGRGKGYSSALAKYALEYARSRKLKIMIYCPFVAKYIKQHPEYNDLIDRQYQG